MDYHCNNIENHEPGNATRYRLVLSNTKKGLLLTWLKNGGIGGPSYLFNKDRPIPGVGYFMEKTGLTRAADAKVLIERAKAWRRDND